MELQWLTITAMTDAQSLIIAAFCVISATGVSCLVYAFATAWLAMKHPDVTKRVERMEGKWDDLKQGMNRAGTWRSEYERPTPAPLKINKDSA